MKLSIRHSLLGVISSIALVSFITIGVDFNTIRYLTSKFQGIANDEVTHLTNMKDISDGYAVTIVDATHKAADGIHSSETALAQVQKAQADIERIWVEFKAVSTLSNEERAQIALYEQQKKKSDPVLKQLEGVLNAGDLEALKKLRIKELYPAIDPLTEIIDNLVKLQLQSANAVLLDANSAGHSATRIQIVMSLFLVVLAASGVIFVNRRIILPLVRMKTVMQELASGNAEGEISGTERQDEIGGMARAVEIFRENALERKRLEEEMRRERDREKTRQSRVEDLITDFRGSIGDIRQSLEHQLGTLQSSSENLGRIAGEASQGASTAGSASQEASSNVDHVANAAGELTAASREISTQVHKASESVTQCMLVAEQADQDISSLANLAERIGAIVDIINSIAEQTNMLALNATIESARAGEAGRSFAVVANEVKALAGQTAKATDEISEQVQAIQTATQQAVGSIRTITAQVSDIQGRTTAIAAAVEEQEASTHEISRAISLASDGSNQVASSVTTMSHSVDQTSQEAGQLRMTSDMLAEVAGNLTRTVDGFLHSVAEDVSERRRATRKAIRQIGVVSSRGRRSQTMVLDISTQGLKIEATPELRLGELIEVEWSSGERFRGRTVWVANGQAGVSLETEIPAQLVAEAA